MITVDQSNTIVKYRAAAYSYDAISEALHISKPTVIRVCKERESDILGARKIAWQNNRKKAENLIDKRKGFYQGLIEEACRVLCSRNLSDMTNKELIQLLRVLEHNLSSIELSTTPRARTQGSTFSDLSDEELGEMVMSLQADYAYRQPDRYPINE